jgi:hypothetical protein
MLFHEPEVVEHRMTGECAELAGYAQHHRPRVDALKPDLAFAEISLDTVKLAEKIVIPERAPKFAVGDGLKADLFLLSDDGRDFAVFDRLQRGGTEDCYAAT